MKKSVGELYQDILLVGSVYGPEGCTKLSVRGNDVSFSVVCITFTGGLCYAACQDGSCRAQLLNKKKIPRTEDIRLLPNPKCPHIYKLVTFLHNFFPDYFANTQALDVGEEGCVPPPTADMNQDDFSVRGVQPAIDFDLVSGLWKSTSLSQHTPCEMLDPTLVQKAFQRLKSIVLANLQASGAFLGPDLVPSHLSQEG